MKHLNFSKIEIEETQRRKGIFIGQDFPKDHEKHGWKIDQSVKNIIQTSKEICREFHFSPHLILKVELEDNAIISEGIKDKLLAFGLKIIDEESKELMVLFSEDIDIPEFLAGLEKYKSGEIATKHVIHKDLFNIIKSITPWDSSDRTQNLNMYQGKNYYDVYLWIFDTYQENIEKVSEIKTELIKHNIRVCDFYVSTSVVVLRIHALAEEIDIIKKNPLVYQIQNIPDYSIARSKAIEEKEIQISDIEFDDSRLDPAKSASICVIDSGIFKGHPLFQGVIGDSKVFIGTGETNDHDNVGHGTMVASICAYGDISKDKIYKPEIYIMNAKVHDGGYISEFNLCMSELEDNEIRLSFEQQNLLVEIYERNFGLDEISKNKEFSNFSIDQKEFIKVIVSRYLGIYEKLIPNQMKEIVEYFYRNYGCRIYNLSQGDSKQIFAGGKPNAWSCVVDELQHKYDILFVVSSGNYHPELDMPVEKIQESYPVFFLQNDNARIIEPANSALSLTVGSIATGNVPVLYQNDNITPIPITCRDELSTLTRVGYGTNKSIKPDLLYYGGDRHIDNRFNLNFSEHPNRGLSVLAFNNKITGSLFQFHFGSSFAAPYISHLAAKLINKYPEISMNTVRALLAYSAEVPPQIINRFSSLFENYEPQDIAQIFQRNHQGNIIFDKKRILCYTAGYGVPDIEQVLDSENNRVTLYSDIVDDEEKLAPDTFHIYEVPILQEFRQAKGKKIIEIVLAYNPEVRKTRIDYLGTIMNFELIRGKSFEEVYQVYSTQSGRETDDKADLFEKKFRCDCKIVGKEIRNKGTLQKMRFEFSTDGSNYGDNYYIVVNSIKKWSDKKQGYSLVASLEAEAEIEIYQKIESRVKQQVRRRVRR
ncbi:hypothetical protein GGQ84_002736 [Desulfitispora alkaliphila]|uniref:S8 family peptidase n=1 Tax=Desulfitispora alkaliphila TaxID=622674 RepID=UPI003D1A477F